MELDSDVRSLILGEQHLSPAQTLTEIAIPFRGRQIYIAGDRTFDDPWTTTFMNDTDFGIRNSLELWMNGINDLAEGNRNLSVLADYQTDLQVEQLDRDEYNSQKLYLRSAWPYSLAAIELTLTSRCD